MFMWFSSIVLLGSWSFHVVGVVGVVDAAETTRTATRTTTILAPLHSKMVAHDSLIKQGRRLSEKHDKEQQEESSSSILHHTLINTTTTTNSTVAIIRGTCHGHNSNTMEKKKKNHNQGEKTSSTTSSSSSSGFRFKLSSGEGHGIVCVVDPPHPPSFSPHNNGYDRHWSPPPPSQPQNQSLLFPPVPPPPPFPIHLPKITLQIPDDEPGFILNYEVGGRVETKDKSGILPNCLGLSEQEGSMGFPFLFAQVPRQGAWVDVSCSEEGSEQETTTPPSSLDFVIVVMDNAAIEERIVIESSLEREEVKQDLIESQDEESRRTNSSTMGNKMKKKICTKEVIRPKLVDSSSKIRGVQVKSFQTAVTLDTGAGGDGEDTGHEEEEEPERTANHSARVHIMRELDGQHDNVLALVVEDDDEEEEEDKEQEHYDKSHAQRNRKLGSDNVFLFQYEIETRDGHVYQRTHIAKTPKPLPRVVPLWIDATHLTQQGDIHVTLGGIDHHHNKNSNNNNNRKPNLLRRWLCTVRVGLVVFDTVMTPTVAIVNGSLGNERIQDDENDSNDKFSNHSSVVDVSAMVTSESPTVSIHVGWIRKGLHELGLSELETGWDVSIEDAICEDPNAGYRITGKLYPSQREQKSTKRETLRRRRRHLLFRQNRDNDNGASRTILDNNQHARQLLSQFPTKEERDVDQEMLMGRRPSLDGRGRGRRRLLEDDVGAAVGPKLVVKVDVEPAPHRHEFLLIHGYCSHKNTWPEEPFRDASYIVRQYEDPDRGHSHDEFAVAIREQVCPYESSHDDENDDEHEEGASNTVISGNIVAHSQGGAASLHLLNFYWSCLDNNPYPGKLIQAVGTPFLGTNIAGAVASLGEILGIGCGSVHDMTEQGATDWLERIQPWARAQVTFYRTHYEEDEWRYNYCHVLTHALLEKPNDGVVAVERGVLPGGIDGGIKTSQCHARDMRDPPQIDDDERNAQMKDTAATPRRSSSNTNLPTQTPTVAVQVEESQEPTTLDTINSTSTATPPSVSPSETPQPSSLPSASVEPSVSVVPSLVVSMHPSSKPSPSIQSPQPSSSSTTRL